MPKPSDSVAALIAQLDEDTTALLKIKFPDVVVTTPKTSLTKAQSAPQPGLLISASLVKPDQPLVIAKIDIDAPFPSFTFLGPAAHFLEVGATPTVPSVDGYYAIKSGEAIIPYAPPGPPPGSAAHRYVYVVYEQPAGLTAETARKALNLSKEPGISARMRWDQGACEKKLGLGKIIAGNYWVTSFSGT